MNTVTLTFHASGQDYAVDFPDETSARRWFQDTNPLDSVVARRVSKDQADTILFRGTDEFSE